MILRDPIHGLVSFEGPEESIVEALLETREMQRLRRIRQLGLASLAYPGAEHTRFSHAIGAAHVMKQLLSHLRSLDTELPFWQRVTSDRKVEALAAALLHDIGHGPFSHLFEAALPEGGRHEAWTTRILLDEATEVHQVLKNYEPTLPKRVAELVNGRHELRYLARAVSGIFDVDRCDYLLRDAYFTGVTYGHFDLDWLIRSLRFGIPENDQSAPPLAIDGARGLPAIESFVLSRMFMFQQVYFHKACRASEWMLTGILARLRTLLGDGKRIEEVPRALRDLCTTGEATLYDYLDMDDSSLWHSIGAWRSAQDPILADLCQRLVARRLFKTYDLYGDAAAPGPRRQALEVARSLCKAQGLDPDTYVGLDTASIAPFEDGDEPLMVVFPEGETRRPGEVSFLLSRLRDEHMERIRLIFPPEIRADLKRELATRKWIP